MKYKTVKQNRPKTPNGLISAIDRKLGTMGITIRKIWRCKAGWGIVYVYADGAKVSKKLFDETIVFTYYHSIEACLKGEYDRIVLGINDGKGLLKEGDDSGHRNFIHDDKFSSKISVTVAIYNSNGQRRYKRMSKSLAEHWGLEIIPDDHNILIYARFDGKHKEWINIIRPLIFTSDLEEAQRFDIKSANRIISEVNNSAYARARKLKYFTEEV